MDFERANKIAEWFRKRGLKTTSYLYDELIEDWHVGVEDSEGNKAFIISATISAFNPENNKKERQ